jgi:hypothetical protein
MPISEIDKLLEEIRGVKVKPEILLAELDELIRNRPTPGNIFDRSDDALAWIGRAAAALGHHNDPGVSSALSIYVATDMHSGDLGKIATAHSRLVALLNEARHSIRMTTTASLNVAIAPGRFFDYFDEVRKIIERATKDLFFIDPYLDADFVSRYLVFAPSGVAIRLLAGGKKLATLLPAVEAFATQSGAKVAVRSTDKHHDRFVFVDGKECFQSGASFKDGATKATTLTQITDAFDGVQKTYEAFWAGAKIER